MVQDESDNSKSYAIEAQKQSKSVSVREFMEALSIELDFELVQGHKGLEREIRSSRIQKLGLMLASFTGTIDPGRVIIIGSSELNYLEILDAEARKAAIQQLKKYPICCIVVTKKSEIPEELIDLSKEESIPILWTEAYSSVAIAKITHKKPIAI